MAFQATVVDKQFVGGDFRLTVEFSDGKQTVKEVFSFKNTVSAEAIRSAIEFKAKSLESLDREIAAISLGAYDYAPLPPVEVLPPEIKLFRIEVERLKEIKNLQDLGILPDSQAFDAQLLIVKNQFKPEFLSA